MSNANSIKEEIIVTKMTLKNIFRENLEQKTIGVPINMNKVKVMPGLFLSMNVDLYESTPFLLVELL